ncbi:TonB-dependent receptor [Polaribacter batillariae]|uniref:TonB-dependent receptor n=1 Tax=Polaribacter batillariae TaxID=2808900 RepID=A0ABX7T0D1_9FLAO|nr:TonB-dependent receptor [Polaribacter batillariae]QTD38474.1 TonB-dependent receptor [Polaribacter batillariae]
MLKQKLKNLLIPLICLLFLQSFSQNKTVTGTVTDDNKVPLIGATIIVKGTTKGTETDFDGKFSINVAKENAILLISYLGYATQEVSTNNKTNLNIILKEDAGQLDEIVVVGYGSQKKINLTGAVATIKSDKIKDRPISQASQALQGLTSGVFVNTSSGEAGNDESNIVIRGVGSLNQSSAPLVLIDGIEGSINDVSPSDIASFSVLKDAAAASIYGTRGAKGVILITTKRGKYNQAPVFKYNTYSGFSKPTVLPDMVIDNRTYLNVYRQAAINSGRNFNFDDADIERYANLPSTDRREIAIRNSAPIQSHEISVNGGSENVSYFASLGYLDQDGWLAGNQNFKRYNTRINLDVKLSEKTKFGTSLSYIIKDANLTPKDNLSIKSASSKGSTIFSAAIVGHPITPLLTESGFYANIDQSLGIERNRPNLQGIIDNEKGKLDETSLISNVFLEYNILDGLKAKATLGLNVDDLQTLVTRKEYQAHDQVTEAPLGNGNAFRNRGSLLNLINQNVREFTNIFQLNYDKSFGKHDFKALLGFNRQTRTRDFSEITETQFGSTDLIFLGNGTLQVTNGINNDKSSLISYFGRINYVFDGKYLLEANLRRDGSSRFGANNRWGSFPSFSAGWVISNEKFWGENHFLNFFKIRGSWGILGSEPSDRFGFLTEFQLGEDYINNSGGAITKLGNPDLKWEETENSNIGFNARFLKNKLTFEADYFIRKTTDILVEIDNPLTSGVSGQTTFNAASMQNKGWEASLNYRHKIGEFGFSIGGNITNVKNEILTINPDLADNADRIEIDRADNIWWIRGEPINVIYGHQFAGVFQSQEEIDNGPDHSFIGNPAPGDIKYTDQNGDGVIDLDDRVVLGNRNPEWYYGVNLNLDYKGFELSALLQGTGNAYANLSRETGPFPFAGLRSYWLDAWTPENPNNKIPRVWVDRRGYNGNSIERSGKYNSFWMKNIKYARLKNIQIAYNFPEETLEKTFLTGARIYVNGQNLFTFTSLKDFDPERNTLQNHATSTLPQSKVVTIGVNLTF